MTTSTTDVQEMGRVADIAEIEAAAKVLDTFIRSLIRGEFSSAHLSWNDDSATNYKSVQQNEEVGNAFGEWISDEEREKGCGTNSKWTLQWYPDTPVGFYDLSASTLPALFAALAAMEKQDG